MNIFSTLKEIAEAFDEANRPVSKRAPIRIPTQALKEMLQEGRAMEAVAFLENKLQWGHARASSFIADLQAAEKVAHTSPKARAYSTKIDELVREHAALEAGAGGSLFAYLFGGFKKR